MLEPIVLIGGFGSHWKNYRHFGRVLAQVSGRRVFVVSITNVTWMVASLTDYILLINRTHKAVLHALAETGADKVILVGHSAGGVVARAYLADRLQQPYHDAYHGYRRVSRLIALGSPLGAIDNARHVGLRHASWLDREFPGAYYAPGVRYLTVYGRLIEGKRTGSLREWQAYRNYEYMTKEGAQWGDGVVPNSLSRIDGVPSLELDGVGHSPWWGSRWYGSDEQTVRMWWEYFQLGDAPALDVGRVMA
ncbi:MAG: alpha/beta hydrolase [Chloroflexi bacterium]|nr:alpha/beta hydrolase [Chloroflexota bacterium]